MEKPKNKITRSIIPFLISNKNRNFLKKYSVDSEHPILKATNK